MNIQICFFVCLAVAVIGVIIAGINIATALSRADNLKSIFITNVIAAILYALGGFGTIGFGIAWIVTYLKH